MNLNMSDSKATEPWRSFPEVILPDSSRVFWDRAKRFAHLAQGHSLSGWLTFLGHITESQHRLLTDYPALPLPADADLAFSRKVGRPPLSASAWPARPGLARNSVRTYRRHSASCLSPGTKCACLAADTRQRNPGESCRSNTPDSVRPSAGEFSSLHCRGAAGTLHGPGLSRRRDNHRTPRCTGRLSMLRFPAGRQCRPDGQCNSQSALPALRALQYPMASGAGHLCRVVRMEEAA